MCHLQGTMFHTCLNLLCIVNDRQLIKDVTFARLKKCLSSTLFSHSTGYVCMFLSRHEILRPLI